MEPVEVRDGDSAGPPVVPSGIAPFLQSIDQQQPPQYAQRSPDLMRHARKENSHKCEKDELRGRNRDLAARQEEHAIRQADAPGDDGVVADRGQYKVWRAVSMLKASFGRIYDGTAMSRTMPSMFSCRSLAYWWHSDTTHVQKVRNAMAQTYMDAQEAKYCQVLMSTGDASANKEIVHFTIMWDGQKQVVRIPEDKSLMVSGMEGGFEVLQLRAEVQWVGPPEGSPEESPEEQLAAAEQPAVPRKEAIVVKPAVLRRNSAACAPQTNDIRDMQRKAGRETQREAETNVRNKYENHIYIYILLYIYIYIMIIYIYITYIYIYMYI